MELANGVVGRELAKYCERGRVPKSRWAAIAIGADHGQTVAKENAPSIRLVTSSARQSQLGKSFFLLA